MAARRRQTDLKAYTANTIANPDDLKAELDEIRQRGWGFENEEYSIGVRGIGAPIWNSTGCIAGTIAIRAPSTRMSFKEASDIAPSLLQAAADISARLGFPDRCVPSPRLRGEG